MSLSEIPSETRVFIDANIFVYHDRMPRSLLSHSALHRDTSFRRCTPCRFAHCGFVTAQATARRADAA